MSGLELAEWYYREVIFPLIRENFAEYEKKIAVGLAGEGSQCLGFDDELSRDHDWGASVCLWLTEEDWPEIAPTLIPALKKLPARFHDYPCDNVTALGAGRTGVLTVEGFYRKFLGCASVPQTWEQWLIIPEHHLAMATNGKVFRDDLGAFTRIRETLLRGYPEDIRKKRLAYFCIQAAQSGQYNLGRIVRRGDCVAAQLALSEFVRASLTAVYLLNNRYAPYYKWMFQGLKNLPRLAKAVQPLYLELCGEIPWRERVDLAEAISQQLISELQRQDLSSSTSTFLLEHGYQIHSRIEDESLRRTNPWVLSCAAQTFPPQR